MTTKSKILFLDIETRPAIVYVWRYYGAFINPEQIIEDGGVLCFGAKWAGERDVKIYSDWEHGHETMIRKAHELISEADAVITYNGDKFDLPKLNGEFVMLGLTPPPPWTSIDVLKTVRRFGFEMNKLAHIGPLMQIGKKVEHAGFSLWSDVMKGDPKAQKKMERYCKGDVVLLERLYKKVRPFVKNHPHLAGTGATACGACGSHRLQKRGPRYTKYYSIQRLQCQNCGSWQDGVRSKLEPANPTTLIEDDFNDA